MKYYTVTSRILIAILTLVLWGVALFMIWDDSEGTPLLFQAAVKLIGFGMAWLLIKAAPHRVIFGK